MFSNKSNSVRNLPFFTFTKFSLDYHLNQTPKQRIKHFASLYVQPDQLEHPMT